MKVKEKKYMENETNFVRIKYIRDTSFFDDNNNLVRSISDLVTDGGINLKSRRYKTSEDLIELCPKHAQQWLKVVIRPEKNQLKHARADIESLKRTVAKLLTQVNLNLHDILFHEELVNDIEKIRINCEEIKIIDELSFNSFKETENKIKDNEHKIEGYQYILRGLCMVKERGYVCFNNEDTNKEMKLDLERWNEEQVKIVKNLLRTKKGALLKEETEFDEFNKGMKNKG